MNRKKTRHSSSCIGITMETEKEILSAEIDLQTEYSLSASTFFQNKRIRISIFLLVNIVVK